MLRGGGGSIPLGLGEEGDTSVPSRKLGGRPGTSWQSAVDTQKIHKCWH